jgi:Leucine-rich repeat (LRR) protein
MIKDFFVKFPGIQSLTILHSNLQEMKPNDFNNAKRLSTIIIQNTSMQVLVNSTFNGCTQLNNLSINQSKLKQIEKGAFQDLKYLQQLLITQSLLEFLEAGVFDSLVNLNTLEIVDSQLTTIPSNIFQFNRKLQTINFGVGKVSNISGIFQNLNLLVTIQFFNNRLAHVDYLNFPAITLDSNQLKRFRISNKTGYVSITDNYLTEFVCDRDLSSMQALIARNNNLKNLKCIRKMKNLYNLDLSYNDLSKCGKKAFSQLTNLWYVKLQGNKILKPATRLFAQSKKLQVLSVDRLSNYKILRKLYSEFCFISLSTINWTCQQTYNVSQALIKQNILIDFNYRYLEFEKFKCRYPPSMFNNNQV